MTDNEPLSASIHRSRGEFDRSAVNDPEDGGGHAGRLTGAVVKSADRALMILEYLGSSGERRAFGRMAVDLSIPKSSLHGLLQTLVRRGWVSTDSGGLRFALGIRALQVGAAYTETDELIAGTSDVMDDLNATLGETLHLGRLDGDQIVYLAKRDAHHPLRLVSAIGARLPAHATALGKALLAERSDDVVTSLLPQTLAALTPCTIVRRQSLMLELAVIRQAGYAIDREESTSGVRCFAVPIGPHSPSDYAMSCSVPISRLDEAFTEEVVSSLMRSRELIVSRWGKASKPATAV